MKKFTSLLLCVAFCGALTFTPSDVRSQARDNRAPEAPARPAGKILNSYRAGQQGARPAWAEQAFRRSLAHLRQHGRRHGLEDADAELALLGADEDDLKQTHVRLAQVYKGVPVFGGQLITHLDAKEGTFANGRVYKDARLAGTTPKLSEAEAVAAAKQALNYAGDFQLTRAELVILPEAVKSSNDTPGATLTYKVELVAADAAAPPAHHVYFINARTGAVEWYFDNLQRGTGNTQHSGAVPLSTFFNGSFFELRDLGRNIITTDVFGNTNVHGGPGPVFTDADDVWGDGTNFNRQTIGADAHFGSALTYDYYLSRHGRRSVDNNNLRMCNRTHYRGNVDDAAWSQFALCANFANGSAGRNWAAVDVVAHEYTHGVTQFSANLTYNNLQSGGSNESFSDIFGTMVEYYSGIRPDYLLGEDVNGALRDMANPRSNGRAIDHITQYHDGMDPHDSSGLQNVAFYLLAEGGAHPSTFVNVKRIGRDRAAAIYYRALTVYLFPSARFADVRFACERAASDLFTTGNPIYHAVQRSWFSTGIGNDVPFNPIDDPRSFVAQHYRDFLLREGDEGGINWWAGTITECGNDAVCEDLKRVHLSRAFWESGDFQNRPDVQSSGLLTPGTGRPYDNRQFVRWCYINYLRRDPADPNATQQDRDGWNFWTNVLNGHGDYNETIRAFLLSTDYRARFGTP